MPYYLKKSRRIVYRRRYRRYRYGAKKGAGYAAKRSYNKLLYNPFARTNQNPKIADGREFLSSGIRLQSVKEIPCGADPKPTFIAVFPGLSNGVYTYTKDGGTALPSEGMPYANHLNGTGIKQDAATKIAKWRLVSQGIRFQLLNNSDENEGWFEMIRYQVYPTSADKFTIQGGEAGKSNIMLTGQGTIPGYDVDTTLNMCEHPTYQTGKLRHLNRMIFKLFANTGDHEFINVDSDVAISQMLDTSFDCLLFKIHGRTVSADDPTAQPTKLLVHVVSNQEVVYDESSSLARYMSPNGTSRGGRTLNTGNGFAGVGSPGVYG